ncbi:sensor histidine kinase [Glaciimonas soli]|uniref:histidine kinase n=1 Tax=Glaciimonas soli TaxID=2590999 RepID=A0A843YNX8_9BURK|nr:sensor histidine kinase [Glaciimonas soli]MQR00690.1 response regulator [Glaciimonas soli]
MYSQTLSTLFSRFRVHQLRLLFTGAGVLTLFLLLGFVLGTISALSQLLTDERNVFGNDLIRVITNINSISSSVRLRATNAEYLWKHAAQGDEADLATLQRAGLVRFDGLGQNTGLMLRLPSVRPDDGATIQHVIELVHGVQREGERRLDILTDSARVLWDPRIYFVTLSGSTVAIRPAPNLDAPAIAAAFKDRARLVRYFSAGLDDVVLWASERREGKRSIRWLPPDTGWLSGRDTFRASALAFDGSTPFGVVVGEYRTSLLTEGLAGRSLTGFYTIVDARGEPIISTSSERPTVSTIAWALTILHTAPRNIAEAFERGAFTLASPLGDTGFTIIYTLPWRVMFHVVAGDMATSAAVAAIAVAILWIFVLFFHRKIMVPLFERSERVFDSENLSRTLIETAQVGLALIDASDHSTLLENAHMQALRAKLDERGKGLIGGALSQDAPTAFHQRREEKAETVDVELHLPTTDDGAIDVVAKLTPAHFQRRPVMVAAFSDVTAERQLARQLTVAKQAADSANAAKSVFFATISHEIRTPLNAILGHLELIERLPQSAPIAARLRTVTSSSRALLDILNDTLDFSKAEAGAMRFESSSFDVRAMIRDTVAMLMPLAQHKKLTLTETVDASIALRYIGDSTRLRQIVVNLVGNAIKFTDSGAVAISVQTSQSSAQGLDIVVTDTGIGIPTERQAKIFEAFGQADETIARRFGGTGLGLALCKRLVEAMGGTIAVTSEPDRGSIFTVTLPLATSADEMEVSTEPEVTDEELRGIHVLVAEDHEVNRELIRDQLHTLGYTCDLAEDGLVALRYFNERHYDIVLTDLGMPKLDGYALATCLRNQGANTPIIAITADVTATDTMRFQEVGISAILSKPMSLALIDAVVRRCLKKTMGPSAATGGAAHVSPVARPAHLKGMLAQQTEKSLRSAHDALERHDWDTFSAQIHSIKGAFKMLQLDEVAAVCRQIETQLAHDPISESEALTHALVHLGERVETALAQFDTATRL